MDAIRTFRRNHPVIFSLAAVVVCAAIGLYGFGTIYSLTAQPFVETARMDDGLNTIFSDGALAIVAIAILFLTGRAAVITRKGKGFFKGLLLGLPILCIQILLLFFMINMAIAIIEDSLPAGYAEAAEAFGTPMFDFASVVVIFSYLLVGLGEELVSRGIVAQTLLERFGTGRAGIWKAIIISSIVFGLTHSMNIVSGMIPEVAVMQAIKTIFLGMFLCAVYFRTGNIWVVAFLHAFNDIQASTATWLFQSTFVESMNGAAADISISSMGTTLLFPILYLCLSLFLLRKSKLGEVQKNWEPELSTWQAEKDAA